VLEMRANGPSARFAYDAKGAETRTALEPVIRRERDRWIVFVDLPQDAFEPDGTVIVGAERVGARGVRSVWPRPVLPWEEAPPRVAFDATTWRPLRSSR